MVSAPQGLQDSAQKGSRIGRSNSHFCPTGNRQLTTDNWQLFVSPFFWHPRRARNGESKIRSNFVTHFLGRNEAGSFGPDVSGAQSFRDGLAHSRFDPGCGIVQVERMA
jgi:hypothetical protein